MNQLEIERRFLLANDNWQAQASQPQLLRQGYLNIAKECTVRVRIIENSAWLTIKSHISDLTRQEYEYPIPLADAQYMFNNSPFKVEKLRYQVPIGEHVFVVDEFFGDNAPLKLAEIELPSEQARFPKPDWLGEEVSQNSRFTNAFLSKNPYGTW